MAVFGPRQLLADSEVLPYESSCEAEELFRLNAYSPLQGQTGDEPINMSRIVGALRVRDCNGRFVGAG